VWALLLEGGIGYEVLMDSDEGCEVAGFGKEIVHAWGGEVIDFLPGIFSLIYPNCHAGEFIERIANLQNNFFSPATHIHPAQSNLLLFFFLWAKIYKPTSFRIYPVRSRFLHQKNSHSKLARTQIRISHSFMV
jgi:hypothetical protein